MWGHCVNVTDVYLVDILNASNYDDVRSGKCASHIHVHVSFEGVMNVRCTFSTVSNNPERMANPTKYW